MRKIFFIAIFLAIVTSANSQGIKITASIDTTIAEIGNPVELTLSAEVAENMQIIFPALEQKITSDIELVYELRTDTTKNNQTKTITKKYIISAFPQKITNFRDSIFTIPPFQFLANNDTVLSKSLNLRVLMIHVDSAKIAELDTNEQFQIFPIKPVKNIPFTFKEFWNLHKWKVIIGVLILSIVALLVYIFVRMKKNQPIVVVEKPKIPPHIIAFESLEKLKDKKLLEQDKVKEYYTELTDIVRLYIEQRFQIPALERTSTEIVVSFSGSRIVKGKTLEKLKQILNWADLAKFAKYRPMQSDNDLNMENAYFFIKKTKIEEKEE